MDFRPDYTSRAATVAARAGGSRYAAASPSGRRILVIEDHRNLANLVKLHLEEIASEVGLAFDGRSGLMHAESGKYDLVVLDLGLPGGLDGMEICRRLRRGGNYLPILMLTAKAAESDRVAGLEIGADDYLTKPFSVSELVARVNALFRRRDGFTIDRSRPVPSTYTYGDLSVDEGKRQVTLRGKRLNLTAKEFEFLLLLASNPGKTFTRGQLLDRVWGYNFTGCEKTVKSHVNRLRTKIEEEPDNPRYIITVWGVGYRFAEQETGVKRTRWNFLLSLSTFAAGALLAGIGYCATTVVAGGSDELRPLYANASDVAEGKRIAETSCITCHGINGISTTESVPHIAGQRPAYLWVELRAYKTGARGEKTMGAAAKSILTDEALLKVTAYYASLDPPQPLAASARPRPEALQAGKAAAAACAGCHGETGISKTAGIPSVAGLDPKYFAAAMNAYKAGQRKNEMMKPIAAALSDADVVNVGQFYAAQKPAPGTIQKGADIGAGKTAAAACVGCHGEKGGPANAETPPLAGQDAQYLAAALKAYKDGSRADDTMKGIAASVDDAAARNIAAYYAALQPQASAQRKPLNTAEWVQRCDRCHGTNGNSTDPRLPALAAQRVDYLAKVLDAYRKGERTSKEMAAMSAVLTEADVENLAAYYGRQQARAVVYVIVPAK